MRGKIRHLRWFPEGVILLFATVVVAIVAAVAAAIVLTVVASAHTLIFLSHTALGLFSRGACVGSPDVKLSPRHQRPSPTPGAAAHEPSPDTTRDGLFLLMGLLAGGLGYAVSRQPLSNLLGAIWANGDIRTFVCAVVFVIVFIILAYLTNPTETSFRAYLTEQSFRQHLSRLDDTTDEESLQLIDKTRQVRRASPDNRSLFHFASRASVSLRTPKHVFHSFGIFTIAAILPMSKGGKASCSTNDHDGSMITDSWYLGAFGRWWRGGPFDTWYQDVVARSNDEESWSSGILDIKGPERHALPLTNKPVDRLTPARGAPPRLRNRDRPSHRSSQPSARSSTPPPLPKSASLPLHSARSPTTPERTNLLPSCQPSYVPPEQYPLRPSPSKSPSASSLFDHSPHILEVLQQITDTKANVHELRTQLSDFESIAAQGHTAHQSEIDALREKKRQEDATKQELKTRTKTLDDSKRAAEGHKRDAEKRLKATQTARDDASRRIDHLDQEITTLQQQLSAEQLPAPENPQTPTDLKETLEQRRHEVSVAEDVVAALNTRAKELEDKLAEGRAKLKVMHDRAETKLPSRFPYSGAISRESSSTLSHERGLSEPTEGADLLPPFEPNASTRSSPRPLHLSLGSLSNFNLNGPPATPEQPRHQFSPFDDGMSPSQPINFSPFDSDHASVSPSRLISPSHSLIPSGLISSIDNTDHFSRSFQSENDVIMDRAWRNRSHERLASSPISLRTDTISEGSFDSFDPFKIRFPSGLDRGSLLDGSMGATLSLQRTPSDPASATSSDKTDSFAKSDKAPSAFMRALSRGDKAKKGLNPDAKAFSFPGKAMASLLPPRRTTQPTHASKPSFDALNPNGMGSIPFVPSSDSEQLIRAFAPSAEEREALQRVLGGSTNTSLERLPSLSDVSPPSATGLRRMLPSWLQSSPAAAPPKPKFSPWGDEDDEGGNRVLIHDNALLPDKELVEEK
ncbi:hypothetical protein BD626DRAFT_421913 [Schizophyllum amplum]|uniref:Proteophosphoglycan ppg4 n=1 Tax=Schizophyllum amplum TaxID=97359 RepID=A0A550CXS6_9AGAR|nr:hypothetical protein BD626DRAFT_421913 [Auriculariopsis ampla]